MNTCIKQTLSAWLSRHPKVKQWGWFILLWWGGLLTVSALTYPLKLLIKSLK
jgi:hypothetical protein